MRYLLFAILLCFATIAHGQSLSYLGQSIDTANSTAYTFSGESLGAAASDRYIIVCAYTRASGDPVVSTLTVGGQSATIIHNLNNAGNASMCMAIAAVPTGTTGDIVVTWDGAVGRCAITWYRATGLASATPTATDTATGSDPSVTITKADGITIAAAACDSGTASVVWTGLTEDADAVAESACHFTSASEESTAGSDTISTTYTNGSTDTPFGAATWAYGASGTGDPNPLTPTLPGGTPDPLKRILP